MKAIVLPDYNANIIRAMKGLVVQDIKIPEPGPGQVLIKVIAAPCNPSDIAFMRGGYGIRKPVPVAMGFECAGQVVETGSDPSAKALLGKRVSCFSQGMGHGTWAEYFVSDYSDCLPLNDEMPIEQAAALCINPFTAYALVEMAKKRKVRAIIQNGASGQVGIFIRRLAAMQRIIVINLVRKDEHVTMLMDQGEKYVLSLANPDSITLLAQYARELKAKVAFDAVGGDTSGLILNSMPAGSELVIYGGLSGKPAGMFNTLDIIFEGKTISGFNLGDWRKEIGEERFLQISEELQGLIIKGLMQTRIQSEFPLEQVQQAMELYIRNMSSGKILFRP
jgi:NADPH:quinone reductase